MIRKISDIMSQEFVTINALTSVRVAGDIILKKGIQYLLIEENKEVIGALTDKDLINCHPNRLVIDAMTNNYKYIDADAALWEAKCIFDSNLDLLLTMKEDEVAGIVTKNILQAELGRHFDLLTGLYKSDYIYYNALQLSRKNKYVGIIFIDINNFGYIDKTYGHIIGDMIIKEMSVLLSKNISDREVYLSRFGGDEFLILTAYDIKKCEELSKELLDLVSSHIFINNINITISLGICCGEIDGENEEILDDILKFINHASLASTKAKKENCGLIIATGEIA